MLTVLFQVLGPIRIARHGDAVAPPGRLRQTLLGVLLARANEQVSVGALAEALWGRAHDDKAVGRLHVQVHRLRLLLDDASRLVYGPAGYLLRIHEGELDADRFTTLVAEAEALADPERRAGALRAALRLWRGLPYEGIDTDLVAEESARLSDLRLAAMEDRFEAELACGRSATVTAELADAVSRHPLRERFPALLMTALSRGGRQAEALRVFRDARRRLIDEVGIEPGPELCSLHARILAGESGPSHVPGPARREAPAQLPPNARGFTGRDKEIAALDRLADVTASSAEQAEAASIVAIVGTAGVGKTALAVRWGRRERGRFADGQLYVDLCGYGPAKPVPPEDVLTGFLLALGEERDRLPRRLPELAARFRTLVEGRRMLLLLDNAHTADQVRPLLPGTSSVFVLITSRDALTGLGVRDGAHRLGLDRLSTAEAGELLRVLTGDSPRGHLAPRVTAALIERCARLPLALRIAAELMRERHSATVADLVAELATDQAACGVLDALAVGDDEQASVRAVFSWSYRRLPADAALIFRMCGLHPGRLVCVLTLAALSGAPKSVVERCFDELASAHLVDRAPAPGSYRMHDLLRAYTTELAHDRHSAEERRAARARLIDYYLCAATAAMNVLDPDPVVPRPQPPSDDYALPALPDRETALWWLDHERPNLVALARFAAADDQPHVPVLLSGILAGYLRSYPEDANTVHELARAAASRQHRPALLSRSGHGAP
ncbi:hypothetical protein BAY61_17820 [Prauserella marina]|nr:hypothetical protein BAY61_17820 [Prauserella marina]